MATKQCAVDVHTDWMTGGYCKMVSKSHVIFALIWFFIASPGHAASFDCPRASMKVEKLVCGDALLSESDDDLAALYARKMKHTADPHSLKKQQREWLGTVRDRCTDVDCLREAYRTRISELLTAEKATSPEPRKIVKSIAEACQVVADFSNRGLLENLSVPETPMPDQEELHRLFGKDTLYGGLSYWHLDFDNDGIPDHLVISVDGTMRVGMGYALSGKKASTVAELIDDENIDLSVVQVGGRYCVLSHCDDRMGKLWRLSKNLGFVPTCTFTPREEPVIDLVPGKENTVCLKAYLSRIRHVTYPLMHALGALSPEDRFWSKLPLDGLAQVDIDNDGRPDNVIRLSFTHGGGRGCDATYIAVTDDTRTTIPDTKLNKLLLDELGGYPCGPNLDVFVHEGITYVDAQGLSGNRTIYRIRADKAETICDFRGRLIHDVEVLEGARQ